MKRLIALGIFGVFLFFSLTIWAQVPQLLNYQGRLTDDRGIPIITATTLRFSLYQGGDAATPGSGTLVYEEDASVTPDDNGVFSHLIGSGTVIYGTLDATVFQTADPVYLEITIDPDGANETLLPRKQIVTVGYSFKSELADDADTVDGQDALAFAPVVHNHDPDYVNEGQADSVTSAMIVDGTIMDADINASANISASKINTSGLDADLLDGKDSEAFVHTAGDDMTGTLNIVTSSTAALSGTTASTSNYAIGVFGFASATSGINYGVYGRSNSASGFGVHGIATATIGGTKGVYGYSASTSGYGVFGISPKYGVYGSATATSGSNFGVYGQSNSTSGYGVYGFASATSGTAHGLYGKSDSPSGSGVWGTAHANGVYGEASATGGIGVLAIATATSATNWGVYGESNSPAGYGVYGTAPGFGVYGYASDTSGFTYGLFGKSNSSSGSGVYGYASATSGTNWGVYGESMSTSGRGVYGIAPVYGIYGYATATSGEAYGLYGKSDSTLGMGVYGTAPTFGVLGIATATSGTNYAVYGITYSSSGYAGFFQGNAHVTGDLTAGGAKTCVQPIDNGKKVLLYAMESPEIWFEDFGTAQLVNGRAVVPIEKIFAQTANIEMGYLLFLTPVGECKGLYISRKDKDSFEVREMGGGTSNITFDYRIVAKRRGYEEVRFDEFTEPEQSPAEPNLPVEKK